MKWFKHPSAMRNSKGVAFIIDHGGLEAYGAFCMTCEVVAEQMGKGDIECKQTLSTRRWALFLGISRAKFQNILGIFRESQLCMVSLSNDEDGNVTIAIPMLAELRDEYSRKSGQTPDSIRRMSPPSEKRREDHKRADVLNHETTAKKPEEVQESGDVFRGGEKFTPASDTVTLCLRNAQGN